MKDSSSQRPVPKFTFGDEVINISRDNKKFTINCITYTCGGFFYSEDRNGRDPSNSGVAENNLQNVKEPVRAFAYEVEGSGELRFMKSEIKSDWLKRSSNHDITYNATK